VAEFRVWAPRPRRVDVVLGDRRLPMTRTAGGWWTAAEKSAGAGADYAFSLDGGPPRADPRSAFQPDGVFGPSRLVDHGSFGWSDHGWRGIPLPGAVLYECHIGTFSAAGTFAGAIENLPHLVDLGVGALEIMPVAEFPGDRGWGYDPVNLFAPHHAYGGPDELKRLVDAAHAHGVAVILDVVYNHFGPAGNYLPEFGPYLTTKYRTNWGDAVNFDGRDSGEVRRFVVDNALMWLRDYHVDGLRIDAVHAISDASATHILAELTAEVRALAAHLRRTLIVIAENEPIDATLVTSPDAGGYGLDACWADYWHHALHAALTGERTGYYRDYGPLPVVAKAVSQANDSPPAGLVGSQLVVCTQNHDQVGNRAAGERSSALMSDGRLRVAAALLLTAPFAPMIFQGEEWGASSPFLYFTDHADAELADAVRQGRRAEFADFGWEPDAIPDPQDVSTFDASKLDWTQAGKNGHADLMAWYRKLLKLRAAHPDLTDPRLDRTSTAFDETAGWLTIRRGSLLVAVNLGQTDWTCELAPNSTLLAASTPLVRRTDTGVLLPPDTAAITLTPNDNVVPTLR
jgi:maltooligosyltrehalose trehalohydrolase